jgi:hypothetical protein
VSGDANERNFGHERVIENILQNYRDAQFLVRPEQNTTTEIGLLISYIKSFDKRNGRLVAGYYLKQVKHVFFKTIFNILFFSYWTDPCGVQSMYFDVSGAIF